MSWSVLREPNSLSIKSHKSNSELHTTQPLDFKLNSNKKKNSSEGNMSVRVCNWVGQKKPVSSSRTSQWGTEKDCLWYWRMFHSRSCQVRKSVLSEEQVLASHQSSSQCSESVSLNQDLNTCLVSTKPTRWDCTLWDNTCQSFLRHLSSSEDRSGKTSILSTWEQMKKSGKLCKSLTWLSQWDW